MLLNRMFTKKKHKDEEETTKITRAIAPLIESASREIFASNQDVLLKEPITYIVHAVWGVQAGAELEQGQKDIHERFLPLKRELLDLFEMDNCTSAQKFAVEYMVCGMVISRILYMIEAFKNNLRELETAAGKGTGRLPN